MKHMLSSALFAGFVAGLIFALLQYLFVEPDILLSERYETGELVHFQGLGAASADARHHMASASPVLRHALTVLFAVLTYCGYGLALMGVVRLAELSGHQIGLAQSLLLGLAGFLCFQMMPAMGLPPDLPGTPAADLTERQIWWAATAAATAIGLWFIAYGGALWQRLAGAGLLAAPHVWGAPRADGFGGVAPPELAASFAAHSLGVGLLTWAALGALVVYFWHHDTAR